MSGFEAELSGPIISDWGLGLKATWDNPARAARPSLYLANIMEFQAMRPDRGLSNMANLPLKKIKKRAFCYYFIVLANSLQLSQIGVTGARPAVDCKCANPIF